MNDSMLSPPSFSIEPLRGDKITSISSAVQRRPIVLVVGMHRSGTSLCSHILSVLGVDMADTIPGPGATSLRPENPRGHWERWEIVEFHDRILRLFNRDYFGRFHDFALPVAWWADPSVVQIRREIVAFLEKRMGNGYFGFKDPRTVRLMPVWHQILNELKLAPRVVLCLRNPAQVARSLQARDGLDPAIGEYRWLVHIIDFFRYTNGFEFCTVEYEEWFENPALNIEKLQKFLDLSWQQSEADLALVLSGIIDPAARHDDPVHREPSQPLVRTLYKLAGHTGQDGARDQIAYIVSQFASFQQLQRPFLQAFEDVAKVAAEFPEIEREATALRAAVSERDAVVEAADSRANGAEARLAEALAEIEAQRAQIAELSGERDEASSLRATLAEHETALAETSHRADEFLAALQVAQAELAARDAAFAELSRQADELRAALQAAQGEATARESAVRRAEQDVKERSVAAAALQGEVATLHGRLARAEREATECTVAVAALQAEIAAVQDTLTAARQVGKAAIAAFRASQRGAGGIRPAIGMAADHDAILRRRDEFLNRARRAGPES
jgi:hypothetical protein